MSKNLVFYIGYSPDFNGENCRSRGGVGGSELALVFLAEEFAKMTNEDGSLKYNVYSFGYNTKESVGDFNGVHYRNANEMSQFMVDNEVEVLIISRYINCFIHNIVRAKKIYLWLHDVVVHPAYNGMMLDDNAGRLLFNVMDKVNGISTQSEWHTALLSEKVYPFLKDSDKLFAVGNGVDDGILNLLEKEKVGERVPGSFIWASQHDRGLVNLMNMWPHILKHMPHATLSIYGEESAQEAVQAQLAEFVEKYSIPEISTDKTVRPSSTSVRLFGKIEHSKLFQELMKSEVWYYPTEFPETYCMLALEAQLAGCLCITTRAGSLPLTIGDRGIIVEQGLDSDFVASKIAEFVGNTEVKTALTSRAQSWARGQTWKERAARWVERFESS